MILWSISSLPCCVIVLQGSVPEGAAPANPRISECQALSGKHTQAGMGGGAVAATLEWARMRPIQAVSRGASASSARLSSANGV